MTNTPQNETPYICAWCEKPITPENSANYPTGILTHYNDLICGDCRDRNGSYCASCNDLFYEDEINYCDICENRFCQRCASVRYCEHCDRYLCDECETTHAHDDDNQNPDEEPRPSLPIREYKKQCHNGTSGENGNLLKTARTFGVEIECYYDPGSKTLQKIADNPAYRFVGIQPDGSLGNNGIEFQTPPLAKQKGEKLLTALCEELNANRFTVNTSCGLHIHLDAKDFTENLEKIKRLWMFYLIFDDVLLSMLPKSRRHNHYCLPLKQTYAPLKIQQADNLKEIEKLWYSEEYDDQNDNDPETNIKRRKHQKYDTTRYNGINLHTIFRPEMKTLEIRYHSGTLNIQKILYWIYLHLTIMERTKTLGTLQLLQHAELLTLTEKAKKFFELLTLEKDAEIYFWERIKKFTPEISNEEETLFAPKPRPICVE